MEGGDRDCPTVERRRRPGPGGRDQGRLDVRGLVLEVGGVSDSPQNSGYSANMSSWPWGSPFSDLTSQDLG